MSQIDRVNAAVREALPALPKELALMIAAYSVPRDTHWAVLPGAERLYEVTGAEDRTFHTTGATPLLAMASAILSTAAIRIESNPSAGHVMFAVTTHPPGTEAKRVPGPGFTYASTSGDYGSGGGDPDNELAGMSGHSDGLHWSSRAGSVYELTAAHAHSVFAVRARLPTEYSVSSIADGPTAGMAAGVPLRFAVVVPPGVALSIIESPAVPPADLIAASAVSTDEDDGNVGGQ